MYKRQRAHRKASGAIQDTKWTLENCKTNLQLTKRNEIKAEIQAAVGLNFEQFCRTTLSVSYTHLFYKIWMNRSKRNGNNTLYLDNHTTITSTFYFQ